MVFLSIPNEKTLSIDVNPSTTTVSAFEKLVHGRTHLPQSLLRYSLRLLNPNFDFDSVMLSDLGFGLLSTVTLQIPLIGGAAQPPANYVAGLDRGPTGFTTRSDIGPGKVREAEENHEFDEFEGNDAGLLANSDDDDDDDKEAYAVWDEIDRIMKSRRKDCKEAKLKEEIESSRASKISEQFGDLKRKLQSVSYEEWDSIPEAGNYSHRSKKIRFESFVPVPEATVSLAD